MASLSKILRKPPPRQGIVRMARHDSGGTAPHIRSPGEQAAYERTGRRLRRQRRRDYNSFLGFPTSRS
jgi:hypothetical protein